MNRRRAFTLVETLVVMAIMATLASILLPALKKSIESTRRAMCASYLHQTGVAHFNWAIDHNYNLVEGPPSYDKGYDAAVDDHDWSKVGNMGHYAVWNRTWSNPSRKDEYGGKYMKHGALVRKGYLPTGRTFYCPSWTVKHLQYGVTGVPDDAGGGWFENEADMPNAQLYQTTSYFYNSMFGSDDYRGVNPAGANKKPTWRGANTRKDAGTSALMADAFGDPDRGVDFHHVTGYTVLYLDGHTKFYLDRGYTIRDLNGGDKFFAGKAAYRDYQSTAWRMFEGRP